MFDTTAVLVVLAAALGFINQRYFKLPHAIGLTIMGALASLLVVGIDAVFPAVGFGRTVRQFLGNVDFAKALLQGVLSFVLFAGALHVDLHHLLRRRWTVAIVATIGVAISTVIVGLAFHAALPLIGLGLPLTWCFVFGALISPTDPVAVLGILRSANMPPRLEAGMAGESLFNDGAGIVLFIVLLEAAIGTEPFSIWRAIELFVVEAFGGLALGLAIGWLGYLAIKQIDEHNVEILITLAVVMGGYAVARGLHVSGPVAMATAGLLIGSRGVARAMSEKTAQSLTGFWSLIDEMINSILFLLIGLEAIVLIARLSYLAAGGVAVLVALLARAVSVGAPMLLTGRLSPFRRGTFPILVWGGLRGSVSVALALSIPAGDPRNLILTTTYMVVIFSVVVQGLTVEGLVRHFADEVEKP